VIFSHVAVVAVVAAAWILSGLHGNDKMSRAYITSMTAFSMILRSVHEF